MMVNILFTFVLRGFIFMTHDPFDPLMRIIFLPKHAEIFFLALLIFGGHGAV